MLSNRNQSYLHQLFKDKLYEADGQGFATVCAELFAIVWPDFCLLDTPSSSERTDYCGLWEEGATGIRFYAPSDSAAEDAYLAAADLLSADCLDPQAVFGRNSTVLRYIFCINTRQRKSLPQPLNDAAERLSRDPRCQDMSIEIITTQTLRDIFWSDLLTDRDRLAFLGNPPLYEDVRPAPMKLAEPALTLHAQIPKLSGDYLEESREEECSQITQALAGGSALLLHGPYGIGLRSLAVAYARRQQAAGIPVYWISYRTSMKATLLSLSLEGDSFCRMPGETQEAADRRHAAELLQKLAPIFAEGLVILADFEDPDHPFVQRIREEILGDFLALPGRKLIVTHDRPDTWSSCIEIGPLSPVHAGQILKTYYTISDELSEFEQRREAHLMDKLAASLMGYPLLLQLAGRLLADRQKKQEEAVLSQLTDLVSGPLETADTDALMERLSSLYHACDFGPSEQKLLRDAALLPKDGMDRKLLYAALDASEQAAAYALIASGWLSEGSGDTLLLHPLLKDYLRDASDKEERSRGFWLLRLFASGRKSCKGRKKKEQSSQRESFADRLYDQFTQAYIRGESISPALCRQLAELFAAAADVCPPEAMESICFRAAYLYQLCGCYREACLFQEDAVSLQAERMKTPDAEAYLYQLYYLVRAGREQEAEERIRAFRKQTGTPELPVELFLLSLLCETAYWQDHREDYLAASRERTELLKKQEQGETRDYAEALLDYGTACLANQQTEEAHASIEELFQLLEQQAKAQVPEDMAAIFWHPAKTQLPHGGNWITASLANRSKRLAADLSSDRNARILLTSLLEGFALLDSGSWQEALEAMRLAADRMKQSGQDRNALYAAVTADLGWLYRCLARPERGIACLEEVLKLCPVLDPVLSFGLSAYASYQLGFLYQEQGNYRDAARCLQAYEDLTNPPTALEMDDSESAPLLLRKADEVCFTLGSVYLNSGSYDKAIEYLSLALETGNLSAYYWLGIAYTDTWQYNQACMTYEEGLALAEKTPASQLPSDSLEIGWLCSGYGYTLTISERDPALGLDYCQKAHEIFSLHYSEDSTTIALSCYRIGLALAGCGQKEEARAAFDQALSILDSDPEYKIQYAAWIREIRDSRIRYY